MGGLLPGERAVGSHAVGTGHPSPRSNGRDTPTIRRVVLGRRPRPQPSGSCAGSPRLVTPVFANTLRRWNAMVRGEIQHCAATSLLDRPPLTSVAILSSI